MEKLSQKQIIIEYLKYIRYVDKLDGNDGWVRAYALRSLNTKFGWLGFQADRRARELAAEEKIEHRINEGYAEYRYKEIELSIVATNNQTLF